MSVISEEIIGTVKSSVVNVILDIVSPALFETITSNIYVVNGSKSVISKLNEEEFGSIVRGSKK